MDIQTYRANRKAGVPAIYAAGIARHVEMVRRFESERVEDVSGPHRYYDRFTVTDDEGTPRWTIRVTDDYYADPADSDCYDADDIRAFESQDAWFAIVSVTYHMADGLPEGRDTLGGVDVGWYWETPQSPLTVAQQILSTVLEHGMLEEARQDAISQARQLAYA